jgi:hypothetical protein
MHRHQVWRGWRSGLGTGMLAAHLVGCISWRTQGPTAQDFIVNRTPRVVRVTRTDNTRVLVHQPVIRGDSLVGRLSAVQACEVAAVCPAEDADTTDYVSVPLGEVQAVGVQRLNVLKAKPLPPRVLVGDGARELRAGAGPVKHLLRDETTLS